MSEKEPKSPIVNVLDKFQERRATKKSTKKRGNSHARRNAIPTMQYFRSPGFPRWVSPWPNVSYRRITIEIPEPIYDEIGKAQHLTYPAKTKVQVISEALIIGLKMSVDGYNKPAPIGNEAQPSKPSDSVPNTSLGTQDCQHE